MQEMVEIKNRICNIIALVDEDEGEVDGMVSPTQPVSTDGTQSSGEVPKRMRRSALQKIQRSNDDLQVAAAHYKQNVIDDANLIYVLSQVPNKNTHGKIRAGEDQSFSGKRKHACRPSRRN